MNAPTDQFIEHMGLVAQTEGLPRIAGQIMGYLVIEGAPRTLAQMTEALKISKASASTNARLLEHHGSVRRVCPVGQRQDAYEAVDDPAPQVIVTLAERFRTNATTVDGIAADMDATAPARERVQKFADFYRKSAEFLDEWHERISDHDAQKQET